MAYSTAQVSASDTNGAQVAPQVSVPLYYGPDGIKVYAFANNARYWVPDPATLLQYFGANAWTAVQPQRLWTAAMDATPERPWSEYVAGLTAQNSIPVPLLVGGALFTLWLLRR